MARRTAETLPDVSRACKRSFFCKSKMQPDGTFAVDTWNPGEGDDPRRVWIEEGVDPARKFDRLDRLLQRSGFFDELGKACAGKLKCKVLIKPNVSIAVQKNLLNYTDPELVDWLVDRVEKDGHDVSIAESQNAFTLIRKDHEPSRVAKSIGYKHPVMNLSAGKKISVPYKEGKITASPDVLDADFVVNFPKGRNHAQRKMTCALKNMYGAIPDANKFELYHWMKSGVSMEDAAVAINHVTPSDFTIVDMIHTIDGEDEHVSFGKLEGHVTPGILMAGKDPLAIDKALAIKMGYDQNEPPVTRAEVDFRGDFDVREPGIVAGSLGTIMIDGKPWKKPYLNTLFSVALDEVLREVVELPYVREGMELVGGAIKFDVI